MGLKETLVKFYGAWENASEIDWGSLPQQFVLKTNNGCGDVIICKDKSIFEKDKVIKYYEKLLKMSFGTQTGQLHYKDIKPYIIAEELLDASKQSIKSSSLVDYKIWCFNGAPSYILTILNRTKEHAEFKLYNTDWEDVSTFLVDTNHFNIYSGFIPKPKNLYKMIEIAKTLSSGHPQIRVDLYEVEGKVYFGELTLTAACGFINYFNQSFLEECGKEITLP